MNSPVNIVSFGRLFLVSTSLLLAANIIIFAAFNLEAFASEGNTPAGCDSYAKSSANVSVTDENNGETVRVNRGQTMFVRLASNPSTGYGWQLVENSADLLKPLGNPVLEAPTGQTATTVYQVFRFQAQSDGSSVLDLQYQRPGQKNSPPEKTYRLNVQMSNTAANVSVSDADNNREVRVVNGDTLIVRLATNPSTGYGWKIAENNTDQLQLLGEPVLEKLAESVPGVTHYQVFRFQVKSAGVSVLELHYQRPIQTKSSPEKTYRIHIETLGDTAIVRLTDRDNGRQVRVAPGNTLLVRLATNLGTGYSWQVVQNNPDQLKPLSNPVLEQTGTQYKVFCFQGQSVGSSVLEFHYRRPWEKNKQPLNIYRLNVQVR